MNKVTQVDFGTPPVGSQEEVTLEIDGIPTTVAVNLAYLDSWRSFAAEFADELPPNIVEVRKWLADRLPDEAQSELSELDDGVTDQHSHTRRNYRP